MKHQATPALLGIAIATALLQASCAPGIERHATSQKDFARTEVLRIDRRMVERGKTLLPGAMPCTDTPQVEIKRITTSRGMVEDRYIVTHPDCNRSNVYYVAYKEIAPGSYMTSAGTGMQSGLSHTTTR